MNRRSFFKMILGFASVAVVGLPKVEAAPIAEEKSTVLAFKVMKNSTYGRFREPVESLSVFKSYKTDEFIGHVCETYHGLMFWYKPEQKAYLDRELRMVNRSMGWRDVGILGRVYLADKVVRISDGKVFKNRYGAADGPMPVELYR